jgi:hypothetical protein
MIVVMERNATRSGVSLYDHMMDTGKRTGMVQMMMDRMVKQQPADHRRLSRHGLGECGPNPSGTTGIARNSHKLPAQFKRQRQGRRSRFG